MPRQKREDLAAFQEWLVEEQYLADSTAVVYASNLRKVLLAIPEGADLASSQVVTSMFESMRGDCSRKGLTSRLSAWKKFKEFAYQKQGLELALPERQSYTRGPPALPVAVRAAVHHLVADCKFKQRDLLYLKWQHVEPMLPQLTVVRVRDPLNPGEVADVPKEHMKALADYSGRVAEDQPLIPLTPGGMTPYPKTGYRRELKLYRDSIEWQPGPLTSSQEVDRTAERELEAMRERWAAQNPEELEAAREAAVELPVVDDDPGMTTAELLSFLDAGREGPGRDKDMSHDKDTPPSGGDGRE